MSMDTQEILRKLRERTSAKITETADVMPVPDRAIGQPVFAHAEDDDTERTVLRMETAMWGLMSEIATLNQRIIKLDERITELAQAYRLPDKNDKGFPATALRHGTVSPSR